MRGGGQAAEEKARLHDEMERMRQDKERIREQHDILHAKLDEACTEVCEYATRGMRSHLPGSWLVVAAGAVTVDICVRGWWGQAAEQHDRDERRIRQAIRERDDMAAQLEALRKEVGDTWQGLGTYPEAGGWAAVSSTDLLTD